jgi:hypothetical protein
MKHLLLVLCRTSQFDAVAKRYDAWHTNDLRLLGYGCAEKVEHSFFLVECQQPISDHLSCEMQQDNAIMNYLTYDVPVAATV